VDFQQVRRRLWGPGSAYSALIGLAAQSPVPRAIRGAAYRAFANVVGANLDEAELALDEYPTFGEFFARKLRDGARAIDPDEAAVISPSDGVVAAIGAISHGTLVQAKGIDYSLGTLLGDDGLAASYEGGAYLTIYLSPRDYHRVHAPLADELTGYDFMPGALWPVNPLVASRKRDLLAKNERVVIRFERYALVMVAAGGVGNIRLALGRDDFSSADLRPTGEVSRVDLDRPIDVARGDELGAFHLGSTVVLAFGPGVVDLDALAVGTPVQFGMRLGARVKGSA
jgi:phosphatidylserine decarboxylase